MNILFFLTPKSEVAYLESTYSIRQTAEKMFIHGYSAVPVLDKDGHYIRTVSDGDLFRYTMEKAKMNINDYNDDNILLLGEAREFKSIKHSASMDELYHLIINQNFIPVLDDRDIFIGIITRKKVIEYLKNK